MKYHAQYLELRTELYGDYGVKVVAKDYKWKTLWKTLDFLFRIITFGKGAGLYDRMTTVVGPYVFFPAGTKVMQPDFRVYTTLRHEKIHIQQFAALGCGNLWLGTLIFSLLYFLIPFPIGVSWFRYKYEREAYAETIKVYREHGLHADIAAISRILCGPSYLWPWRVKSAEKWLKENT
jgi:hypothetical protein